MTHTVGNILKGVCMCVWGGSRYVEKNFKPRKEKNGRRNGLGTLGGVLKFFKSFCGREKSPDLYYETPGTLLERDSSGEI